MPPITALILAAGRGRRLAPLTDELPKCLLPICGTSPLELALASLSRAEVNEVVILTGHAHERISAFVASSALPYPVRELFNPRYDTANNIYSAFLARGLCSNGFLLINSDVAFHPHILDGALGPPEESWLLVDPTQPPRAEAMKVRFDGQRLAEIGKHLDPQACDGEYIGLARFDARGAQAFFARAAAILEQGGHGEWYEAAIGEAAREVPFGRRSTRGLPWIEIDDRADLERARTEIVPAVRRALAF